MSFTHPQSYPIPMILHIDMDAFYASVEEREQPHLRGKPLAVGGSPQARGVVAAANYAARKFGVHSAMPSAAALRLCPQLRIIAPRGALYGAVSAQIIEIFHRYTPVVEPLSLDEAFLDPTGSERLHGEAEKIGVAIRRDILSELKLVASVGIGPNKFLAKLASGHDKPDGFTVIHAQHAQRFLDALAVGRIWGVGKATQARLNAAGIYTVAQLRQVSARYLQREFGQHGERLWQLARGVDERRVSPHSETKSISKETTFAVDIRAMDSLQATAMALTEQVCYRLRGAELCGKTVTLKIRFADFTTITRARSLPAATAATADIWRLVETLLVGELARKKFAVRLLGVGITHFELVRGTQGDLFTPDGGARQRAVDELSDKIKRRYGKTTILRGRALGA